MQPVLTKSCSCLFCREQFACRYRKVIILHAALFFSNTSLIKLDKEPEKRLSYTSFLVLFLSFKNEKAMFSFYAICSASLISGSGIYASDAYSCKKKEDGMQNTMTYGREIFTGKEGRIKEAVSPQLALLRAQTADYIDRLKDFESRCAHPEADPKRLQAEIKFINECMLDACAEYERNESDPFALKEAQVEFREKTNPILSKSYCINRTRIWPQGHQGDFYTLELAYKNTPLSEGIGYYLDRYMLSDGLADGVRERIFMLRALLKKELHARRNAKVLDVACGSCREVFELASDIIASGAKFTAR